MAYMTAPLQKTARARAENVTVSSKQCIEICTFLRGKTVESALATLERVLAKKEAIPFRRFTNGLGHRRGQMAAGRYPQKASAEFITLIQNVKLNAVNQGLTGQLRIIHLASNRASRPMRNRLKFRGEFKRTHLEIMVQEVGPAPDAKPKKATKKATKAPTKTPVKETPKSEPAPEKSEKKETPKAAPAKEEPAKAAAGTAAKEIAKMEKELDKVEKQAEKVEKQVEKTAAAVKKTTENVAKDEAKE